MPASYGFQARARVRNVLQLFKQNKVEDHSYPTTILRMAMAEILASNVELQLQSSISNSRSVALHHQDCVMPGSAETACRLGSGNRRHVASITYSVVARHGRRRWAILLRRGAMTLQPSTRETPRTCDRRRFSAAPTGRSFPTSRSPWIGGRRTILGIE
jgi:hypothetical protein